MHHAQLLRGGLRSLAAFAIGCALVLTCSGVARAQENPDPSLSGVSRSFIEANGLKATLVTSARGVNQNGAPQIPKRIFMFRRRLVASEPCFLLPPCPVNTPPLHPAHTGRPATRTSRCRPHTVVTHSGPRYLHLQPSAATVILSADHHRRYGCRIRRKNTDEVRQGVEFEVTIEIPKGQRNKYEVDH